MLVKFEAHLGDARQKAQQRQAQAGLGGPVHHQADREAPDTDNKMILLGSENGDRLPMAKQRQQQATPVTTLGLSTRCTEVSVRANSQLHRGLIQNRLHTGPQPHQQDNLIRTGSNLATGYPAITTEATSCPAITTVS
jgi:hypothetical protein